MLDITNGKGFHLTFKNGLTISVQFGTTNYCDNSNKEYIYGYAGKSKTAEVAIWDKENNWKTKEFTGKPNDDVTGWLNADEVAELIYKVKNYEVEIK